MIRVLIVDDQLLMRTGFRMILEAEPGIEVVGEGGDGYQAMELAAHVRPDVVLMDIRMPRMDGIEATRRLAGTDARDPVRVLILTTFDLDELVLGALRAGASGFLLKDAPPEDMVEAIRVVAHGDRHRPAWRGLSLRRGAGRSRGSRGSRGARGARGVRGVRGALLDPLDRDALLPQPRLRPVHLGLLARELQQEPGHPRLDVDVRAVHVDHGAAGVRQPVEHRAVRQLRRKRAVHQPPRLAHRGRLAGGPSGTAARCAFMLPERKPSRSTVT